MSYFHSHVIHVVFAGTINDPCITIVPLHCLLVLTCDYVFFFLPQANVNFTLAVVDLEYRDPHCFFFLFLHTRYNRAKFKLQLPGNAVCDFLFVCNARYYLYISSASRWSCEGSSYSVILSFFFPFLFFLLKVQQTVVSLIRRFSQFSKLYEEHFLFFFFPVPRSIMGMKEAKMHE